MSCNCGYADECDGEHGVLYPLQDGGMCSVIRCQSPKPSDWKCIKESREAAEHELSFYRKMMDAAIN
jgi:hypothetical protein